jgi:hypothetical protein
MNFIQWAENKRNYQLVYEEVHVYYKLQIPWYRAFQGLSPVIVAWVNNSYS